jgi:hypothetical protein
MGVDPGEAPLPGLHGAPDAGGLLEGLLLRKADVLAGVVGGIRRVEHAPVEALVGDDALPADGVGQAALRVEQQHAVGAEFRISVQEMAVLQVRVGGDAGHRDVAVGADVARGVREADHVEPDTRSGVVADDGAGGDRADEVGIAVRAADAGGAGAEVGVALDGHDPVAAEVGSGRRGDLDELVGVLDAAGGDIVVVEFVDPGSLTLAVCRQ